MIKPPVVVVDRLGCDLRVHPSVAEADLQLEAIDVRNNAYEAYDAEGRLLALDVYRDKRPVFFGLFRVPVDLVRIQQGEDEPAHAEELRSVLNAFLRESGMVDDQLEHLSLEELLQRVMELTAAG